MWWVPIAMYGMNKLKEGEAKEEAKRQQLYNIRSNLAAQFGSPGYGEQTAKSQHEMQRQLDEERRRRNAQLLKSVFEEGLSNEGDAEG